MRVSCHRDHRVAGASDRSQGWLAALLLSVSPDDGRSTSGTAWQLSSCVRCSTSKGLVCCAVARMYSGRERKTKPTKEKTGLRQRKKGGADEDDAAGWSSALDPEGMYGASKHARKGRDRKQKKSGRHQAEERTFDDVDLGDDPSAFEPYFQPPEPWPVSRPGGMLNIHKVTEKLFVSWEELLGSREALKSRIDTIAAVHGWEGASKHKSFLGGVEPTALLNSIQAEMSALNPAADALESLDLILELQKIRKQLEIAGDERDRLAEDLQQSLEDCFEARDQLAGQSTELEILRQEAMSVAKVRAAEDSRSSQDGGGAAASTLAEASGLPGGDPLAAFKVTLSRGQVAEGRRVVHALEKLKLPDESTMGQRELACWHENKKTITNSLKTLSSQIYSATTRILYEIIQNADDCSFEEDSDDAHGQRRAVRELYLECSDNALVAFHNENGFQPKDLYAMCQVGESSKAAGSGKIGRKGIGFKSVFQICDRPVVLSPPFQFCFDTIRHEVFGYIVPSWVENPQDHVPAQHSELLERIFPGGSSTYSATGTLLVCPIAQRVQGLDLMRDLSFDGLSLAFLKNLEQVSFVSSVSRGQSRHAESLPAGSDDAASNRREVVYTLERTVQDLTDDITVLASGVLKGVSVVSHSLSQVAIIERRDMTVTRRRYRLHSYTILKYKSDSAKTDTVIGSVPLSAGKLPATTTISLAFPVDDKLAPLRTDGELVFAYLPVTAAGFGFAINADFELVASRQDVNDSHSGNHVLLGRIPSLFVHAILTDPCLGEDAFPTYLPDVEGIRKDRSGGGRKFYTLASALHRETGAWMMIPTEDVPERVKRKHVVLRPRHLSATLVPNSVLKEVTRNSEMGEINFAHADAVNDMALENCIDYCPVSVVLDCIRTILDPVDEDLLMTVFDEGRANVGSGSKQRGRKRRGKRVNLWPGDSEGDFADYARRHHQRAAAAPSITEEQLLAIWQYLAAECKACVAGGEACQSSLRLILDAVVGAGQTSQHDDDQALSQQFRIFPVRGSARLRLHSEFGVPLSTGLSPSLAAQGPAVLRLAESVIPQLDTDRLHGVDDIVETMQFLRIGDATEMELEQQLRNCFRFGLATTADPQLWWDSFKYAVSKGHVHGLVDFMPGAAIALPLADGAVVSSRDVQRLSVGLPCLLGMQRKPSCGSKYLLAIPSSVSSWSSRVRWELAMVQAFGLTFPRSEVERIPMGAFATDLLFAVTEARETSSSGTLEALVELIDIYKSRMGSLLPLLQSVLQKSLRPEECLLEKRAEFQPFASSCSPKYVDELLDFCNVTLSDDAFHNIHDLLETSLGMLRLRTPGGVNIDKTPEEAVDDVDRIADNERCSDDSFASAEEEEPPEALDSTVTLSDDDDNGDDDRGASDEVTWMLLERLLGFHHTFEPHDCSWLLYSVLTPKLVEVHEDLAWDQPRVPTLSALASSITYFLRKLETGIVIGCSSGTGCVLDDVSANLWPLICNAGGIWLGGEFVNLECCVWKVAEGADPIWEVLMETGCQIGNVVAIESSLVECLDKTDVAHTHVESFLVAIGNCCIKGATKRHGSTWSPGLASPALPHPTPLEMMLDSTLPIILEREFAKWRAGSPEDLSVENELSDSTLLCYAALIATLENGGFPRGRRWLVPVPSVSLATCQLVVDRGFNRQLARDAAALLVFPDDRDGSTVARFSLRHFGEHCLHPLLVPLFASVAERQSVGFESPRARVQRTFRRSLRLAVAEASGPLPATPAEAAAAAAASRAEGGNDGSSDQLWSFISEVYGRSSEELGGGSPAIPSGLSDADNWELLMWAAITCAKQYYLAQVATSSPQHAFRYQETLRRVRQIVPFVKVSAGREAWEFLAESHDTTTADADGAARGVLLLRTLFGFELWGNLSGVELLGRAPTYTADIPTSILFSCTNCASTQVSSDLNGPLAASFPEDLERQTLVLVWEWFLLEVAGAAPPNVLWSTLQEPIIPLARPRIRLAEAELRAVPEDRPPHAFYQLSLRLLDSICDHTQVDRIMDDMDAVDAARAAEAAREAEARRRQREAARARQRAEAEALRRQRELERREAEQQRLEEREQRRARREYQDAMEAAARALHESQPHTPPQPQHGRRSRSRQDSPDESPDEDAPQRQSRSNRVRAPEPAPEPDVPRTVSEMRGMIRRQQEEIERMRSQLETTVRLPANFTPMHEPEPNVLGIGRMANTFVRLFGGVAAGGDGGGGAPPVRRHIDGQTMRESEVKGKLARFLAGMRAYERQRAATSALASDAPQQPMPPVLSEFIVWAGDVLAGGEQHRASAGGRRSGAAALGAQREGALSAEESARRYVGGSETTGGGDATRNSDEDEEESCCICLELLRDSAHFDQLGEPLETACGHRFHAVCYAKTMEATQQDPWCPICRSDTFGTSARFL